MIWQRLITSSALATALALSGCDDGGKDDKAAASDKSGKSDKADKASKKNDKVAKDESADSGDNKDTRLAEATPASADADMDEEFAGFDPRVVKAAKVARGIEDDPKAADDVLAANELDREALDTLMFEIARDPDLTGQYRIARGM